MHGPYDAGVVHVGDRWHAGNLRKPVDDVRRRILEGGEKLPEYIHKGIGGTCPLKEGLAQDGIPPNCDAYIQYVAGKL